MKTLIVDKSNLKIVDEYEGTPKQDKFGGPYGRPELFVHIQVDDDVQFMFMSISEPSPGEYIVGEDTEAKAEWDLKLLREARDQKLKECDWTQLPDVALGSSEVAQWAAYRQALRDITESYQSLDTAVWPDEPTPEV